MTHAWYDVLGYVGVLAIVGSYLLMQLGRLEGRSLTYSASNAVGAALILVSLAYRWNPAAVAVEAFWLAISLIGVGRCLRRRGDSTVGTGVP